MTNVAFDISERTEKGKKTRKNGEIPCVLYGEYLDKPITAKMSRKNVDKLLTYPKNSMLTLNLNGQQENCVVKELQKDNFGKVIHIDFEYVKKNQNIKLGIPVNFQGEGMLETKRLVLETFFSEVELSGEADKLPESLEFDVSNMKYGDTVRAKDLTLPEGIKLVVDDETVLAKIAGSSIDEVEEEATEEAPAENN